MENNALVKKPGSKSYRSDKKNSFQVYSNFNQVLFTCESCDNQRIIAKAAPFRAFDVKSENF